MIVSVNWLKQYTDIKVPIDELATLIGARLVEIEEVIDLGARYKDAVVVKVVSVSSHPNADKLKVVEIDSGKSAGNVQVVCGAPNVHEGMLTVWLPPGAVVPSTHGSADEFTLDAREFRGVKSHGMLASASELAISEDHSGLIEIDKEAQPGDSFSKLYELDDYLLDIENKSLTHRPDCFGVIGLAREVAAILGQKFTTPDWLMALDPQMGDKSASTVQQPSVKIADPKLCARYQAVVLSGANQNIMSPLQIQSYLSRVGLRPINAIVDTTNYLMVSSGQPLHAFDYDKFINVGGGKAEIVVRTAKDSEKLRLLDGRDVSLSSEDIVICSGDKPVALAGAMGGNSTEIDANTKNILIESATFNLYNLRGTQMRHGIFSEAITRFTKGQPAKLTAPVLASATRLIMAATGAERVSDIVESYPVKQPEIKVKINFEKFQQVLGKEHSQEEIVGILKDVDFDVEASGSLLVATVPYWRGDINIPEDLVEEVGRIKGFDNVKPSLAKRDFTAVRPDSFDELRSQIRKVLVRSGANEVLTYSFVHGDVLNKAGQKAKDSYKIVNSLSPDLQYYRQNLTPSLLSLVHPNIKAGFDDFALFEINKAHNKVHGLDEENVPGELNFLTLVLARKKSKKGAPYYEAKKYLDFLAHSLGLELTYKSIDKELGYPVTAAYEYRRSALAYDKKSGELIGIVGEYKASVAKNFKLPSFVAGFEIEHEALLKAVSQAGTIYKPLSRYPSTSRDVCFQVANEITYAQIFEAAEKALTGSGVEYEIAPADIYQPKDGKTKNITIHVHLTSHDHTLRGDEANNIIDKVSHEVTQATRATVV